MVVWIAGLYLAVGLLMGVRFLYCSPMKHVLGNEIERMGFVIGVALTWPWQVLEYLVGWWREKRK